MASGHGQVGNMLALPACYVVIEPLNVAQQVPPVASSPYVAQQVPPVASSPYKNFAKEKHNLVRRSRRIRQAGDGSEEEGELERLEKSFYLCPLNEENVPQPGRSKVNLKGETRLIRDFRTATGCLEGVETILKWFDKKEDEIGNESVSLEVAVLLTQVQELKEDLDASMITPAEAKNFTEGRVADWYLKGFVPAKADLYFDGGFTNEDFELGPSGKTVYPPREVDKDRPKFDQITRDGEVLVHLSEGLSIRKTEHEELLEIFMGVWPRAFGYGKKAVNSRLPKSLEHMEAFDKLISFIWPGNTTRSYMKPPGAPVYERSKFHEDRVLIAQDYIFWLWETVSAARPLNTLDDEIRMLLSEFLQARLRRECSVAYLHFWKDRKSAAWHQLFRKRFQDEEKIIVRDFLKACGDE